VFTLGSLFCGLSGTLDFAGLSHIQILWVARAVQGLGGAMTVTVSMAIIAATFSGRERGLAIGIWSGVVGLATAIGPLVGGALVESMSWQAIFFVNVPIGVVGLALTVWAVAESRDDGAPRSIDIVGLLTITVGMVCLVLALIQGNDADKGWTSPYILSLLVVAVAALLAFVLWELRIANPMVDPRVFKRPSFTGACLAAFSVSAGLYALFFFVALYLQNVLGFGPLDAGLRFLPLSLPVMVVAPLAGALIGRIGARSFLSGGLALSAVAVALMARISPSDQQAGWVVLLPSFILAGGCSAAVNSSTSVVVMASVARERAGMASGTSSLCRQLGIAVGIAFLGALLTGRYNGAVHDRILAIRVPAGLAASFTPAVKATIIREAQAAGPTAGSLGLRGYTHARSYLSPVIGQATRAAFVNALQLAFQVGALLLALGALAALLLVRQSTGPPGGAPSAAGDG
jgi:EmrB/QacA subfamily drug resistance transporter